MRESRGFTLIELLVVIAIVSLLASIIYSNIAIARTKSIDAAKVAQLASVRTALNSFYNDKGRMPHNYTCVGSCTIDDNRSTLAIEDTDSPANPVTESGKAYRASMQELVSAGYLPQIPESPGGAGYAYYDYGPGSSAGAIIGTSLETTTPSAGGSPGSCRPFPAVAYDVSAESLLAASPFGNWQACSYLDEGGFWHESFCPPTASTTNEGGGSCVLTGTNTYTCTGTATPNPGNGSTCVWAGGDNISSTYQCSGGSGGGSGNGPNLCAQTSSKDYCLCSSY